MMPFKLIAGSLAVAVMLCLVSAARAQNDIVSFDERAVFTAASTGLTKVDFEGLAPNSGVKNYTMPGGLAAGGLTFRTSGGGRFGGGHVTVGGAVMQDAQAPASARVAAARTTLEMSIQGVELQGLRAEVEEIKRLLSEREQKGLRRA